MNSDSNGRDHLYNMQPEIANTIEIHASDIQRIWRKGREVVAVTWARIGRRWKIVFLLLAVAGVMITYSSLHHVQVPRLRLEYNDEAYLQSVPSSFRPHNAPFNASKVALLIENRPLPLLAPLLLHFIAVVPPDWRFRFMGSPESVAWVNSSHAVRSQVDSGKLDLTYIPTNMSTNGQEMISRFLTTLWLYETVLRPAEWLLIFQTDSILCANSRQNLNDFLAYDWVGAPWNPSGRFGGNGGLSLRRVSAIIEVLRDQVRADGSEPEDVWLTERLGHRPGARMANGSLSLTFSGEMHSGENVQAHSHSHSHHHHEEAESDSIPQSPEGASADSPSLPTSLPPPPSSTPTLTPLETEEEEGYYIEGVDDWRDGFYEPMGYHTGGSGTMLHAGIWGDPRVRQHIWQYCPEVKMTLAMDVAKYVPGDCMSSWKRDGGGEGMDSGSVGVEDLGYGTEIIDGVVYPILPPNLVPW